jgi:LPXTG-motif cell wall-anchored protein
MVDNPSALHKNDGTASKSDDGSTEVKTGNTIWRVVVVIALAAMACVLVPSAASAQGAAPRPCEVDIADYEGTAIISIDPLVVAPGGTVTITGAGFPPNVIVPLLFNGTIFAEPVTDAVGGFEVVFTVPADTPPGQFTFEALCGAFTLSNDLSVVVGGGQVPLPTTGADNTMQIVQIAAVLLILGALMVFLARRQSQRRQLRNSLSVH